MRFTTQINPPTQAAKNWLAAVALTSVGVISAPAIAQQDPQALTTAAQTTFSDFVRDPDMRLAPGFTKEFPGAVILVQHMLRRKLHWGETPERLRAGNQ